MVGRSPYGGYGGVRANAKYTPPVAAGFTPQPSTRTNLLTGRYVPPPAPGFTPQPATIPFTKQIQNVIYQALSSINNLTPAKSFVLSNSATIVLRYLTSIALDGSKTFTMFTSAHGADLITYTTPTTSIDLGFFDGGTTL